MLHRSFFYIVFFSSILSQYILSCQLEQVPYEIRFYKKTTDENMVKELIDASNTALWQTLYCCSGKSFEQEMVSPHGTLICSAHTTIVACLNFISKKRKNILTSLRVHPDFRKEKWGKRLFDHFKDFSKLQKKRAKILVV